MPGHSLVLILGDQLTPDIPSLRAANADRDRVLMVEVDSEATHVPHHKKKLAFIFSAMRHFARKLQEEGWRVDYVKLDDPENTQTIAAELDRAIERRGPERVIIARPGEWRVEQAIRGWKQRTDLPVECLEDERFICSRSDFEKWAHDRKQLRMEHFYREMRRKTGLLMDGDEPEGGKWNYDAENRKPANQDLDVPGPKRFQPDAITREVLELVGERFADNFGDLEPFWFGTSAQDAAAALDHFIETALPRFGDYQDAMLHDERFLYHSVLSLYLNVGLLDPLEVCRRVERAYKEGAAPINAVEGFIRQIIGWREFVRGIYWLKMPDYVEENYFDVDRALPEFYWSGETDMECLRAAILQTREEAYAHHIQRLMVTGNFAMLAGVDPKQVHEWYLAVYADAYEWVELPNTLGMSQFADGGLLGSKPYASSGNYINKMSDYCPDCAYDVKEKTGKNACPFNSLYWDFLARNEDKLRGNSRLARTYATWDRMKSSQRSAYRKRAAEVLDALA